MGFSNITSTINYKNGITVLKVLHFNLKLYLIRGSAMKFKVLDYLGSFEFKHP